MSAQSRRLAKRQEAAAVLEKHSGPVMKMLAEVVSDLATESEGLRQFEADMQVAAELSYRLDKAVTFDDPLFEALDGVVTFFVALGAIGIWRAVAHQEKLRGKRLDRLRDRLEKRGPKIAAHARRRLERRIKRLEA